MLLLNCVQVTTPEASSNEVNEITNSNSTPDGNAAFCEKLEKCSTLNELRQKLAQFAGKKARAENVLDRARKAVEKRYCSCYFCLCRNHAWKTRKVAGPQDS
jgi:antitoxin component HigA of HigAB toxin-antitoxin module